MKVRIGFVLLLSLFLFGAISCSKSERDNSKSSTKSASKAAETGNVIKEGISFSKKDYFYSEDTKVEILSSKPGTIYYTTDGSEPDKNQNKYRHAIKLIANKDTKANCIKAKAFFEDGTESKTMVHTYFVGKNVKERFDTLIFSVTTDPYNLYDYEHGIFVEGKLRDEYKKDHPGTEVKPYAPANFNLRGKDSEREIFLEVLEPNGKLITGQAAGIRTYGGWSRAREQKSIKLFARKEYDETKNKFKYEFLPNRLSSKGSVIDSYKQLVLRNCGNDNGFAFIRDELFQTLAAQAGYQDFEAVRPAAMFVNGEYRGFFWLHEVYCDEYFEDHYGKYKGSFEILEGGEIFKNKDSDNARFIQDYNKMYSYAYKDLTIDNNYKELCELLDVENYLSYYAMNVYIGNEDWPHNNYKTYRYYTAKGETYKDAPFDGKWRYMLHDMDYSTGIYGRGPNQYGIETYLNQSGEIKKVSPLFGQLMRREDCREIFIKKTMDLINGALAPNNAASVLEALNGTMLNELSHTYNKGLLDERVRRDQLGGRLMELKSYISLRANYVIKDYQEFFQLGDCYKLKVNPVEDCRIKINSFVTDRAFEGSYYADYPTSLSVILPKGRKLNYWLVNGTKVEEQELLLTAAMVKDNQVQVEAVLK